MSHTVTFTLDAAGRAAGLRVPGLTLTAVAGPAKRKSFGGAGLRTLVGSGSGADVLVPDDTVSAAHAELLFDEQGLRVVDLGSRNGTFIGARRVQEAWLASGDELRLGKTVLRLTLTTAQPLPVGARTSFGQLLGESLPMRLVYDQLARLAAHDTTVLIEGETGTGKELAADALVTEGSRREGPVVVVDCRALSESLVESELFGHARGAFTGALKDHVGAFERAHQGTLVLDEVGELPKAVQPKLLGVLERREVLPLGAVEVRPFDVRVIATTHRHLETELNAGRFRADLFFRLAVGRVRLPPLRERPEDVPLLVAHFLGQLGPGEPLAPDVLKQLHRAQYPGNVRELRNAVHRARLGVALSPSAPATMPSGASLDLPFWPQKERAIADYEKDYLVRLLSAAKGNIAEAARLSGISRVHLYGLLRLRGLH